MAPEDGTMGFQPQQGIEMDEEDVDDTEFEEDQESLPSYKHASMSVDIRGEPIPALRSHRFMIRRKQADHRHEPTPYYHLNPFHLHL